MLSITTYFVCFLPFLHALNLLSSAIVINAIVSALPIWIYKLKLQQSAGEHDALCLFLWFLYFILYVHFIVEDGAMGREEREV